ncbi:MAG: flagellar assembly protein FliX [Rickettsiales bacterium]
MINKIGYTNPTNPTQRAGNVRRTSKTGSSSFIDALDSVGGVEETQATSPVAAMSGIGVLLGAQEVSEEEVGRRKAFKQGKVTLDALAELRDALIIGSLPLSTIRNLETIVAQERSATNDPVLNGILDEIELRAAVEIAKLEAAGVVL